MSPETSSLIQALAAIVIAFFTWALWRSTNHLARFTKDYVAEMRRSNELQEQILRLQSVTLTRQSQSQAPSLVAASAGRSVNEQRVDAPLRLENVGGSAAYAIEVRTSWGTAQVSGPVPAGEQVVAYIGIARHDWEAREDKDPVVDRFRFKDPRGGLWEQSPGTAPREAPPGSSS